MRERAVLRVGPVRWLIEGPEGTSRAYAGWPYQSFALPEEFRDPASETEIRIRTTVEEVPVSVPDAPPLFAAGSHWAAWRESQGWLFCAGWRGRSTARAACRVNAEYTRAAVFVEPRASAPPFRFPLDQIVFWGALARRGGLLLHAAGVLLKGDGIALAGRSGAGKSTLSSLCAAAGWRILNDDRVAVYPENGRWRIAGTPWHGSGRFAEHLDAPLNAVCALHQDRANHAEAMDRPSAIDALLPIASIPWFDETSADFALRALNRLAAEIPVFRFRFTKTPAAVEALCANCFH